MSGIPKGYKKTDVGVIPEEWEVWELRQVCNMKSGSSITSEKIRPVGNFPCYGGNGLRGYTFTFNHEGTYPLIGRQGALCGNVNLVTGKFYASEHAVVVTCKCNISPYWLFFILERMELNQYTEASAQPGLSVTKVIKLSIPHPPLPEQKAIAEVLSDMDALIEVQKELIAKKRDIKQGTMQDLLSGRVRLPGYETKGWKHTDIGDIPDDWQVKSFSNIAYLIKETVDPTSNKSLNCVELEHLSSSTGLLIDFGDLSDKSSFKNKFQRGDVLFGKLRSYLRKFWLCQWSGCCSTEIWVFRPKSITNSVFLKYIVSSDQFVKVASESFGTHMPRADWNVVKECFFAIPTLYSEQQAIAQVLSDMDNEIETLEAELEKLNQMKRGMMQELLTGRIRLI